MLQTLFAAALLLAPSEVQLAEEPTIIPMDHGTKHVTVMVELNGKGPFLFQVDTYSSGDGSIDDDLVRELGLIKSGTVQSSDGHSVKTRDLVTVDELVLGGAVFRGLTLTVNDYDWVKRSDGKQVHGILGFASFRELLLTFDYPGNRLVLSRDHLEAGDAHTIPFSVEATGSPDIQLVLDGDKFLFGIDTGHTNALSINRSLASELPTHGEPEKYAQMLTHHNSFDVYTADFAGTLDLAGYSVEGIELRMVEGWSGFSLLGYQLLRSYAVSFDQRSGLVSFNRPPLPKAAALSNDELDHWVGTFACGQKRYIIEREGDALFFRFGKGSRIPTSAIDAKTLRLESEATQVRLDTNWFGRRYLEIEEHPDRPIIEAPILTDG